MSNSTPRLCSKMYDQLAKLTIPGYQAMHDDPTELDKSARSSIAAAPGQACQNSANTRTIRSSLTKVRVSPLAVEQHHVQQRTESVLSQCRHALNTALDGLKLRETGSDQPGGGEAKPNDNSPRKTKCQQGHDGKPTADLPRTGSDIVPIIAVILLPWSRNHCRYVDTPQACMACSRNHHQINGRSKHISCDLMKPR